MRNECRIALVSLEENHKIVTSNAQVNRQKCGAFFSVLNRQLAIRKRLPWISQRLFCRQMNYKFIYLIIYPEVILFSFILSLQGK